MSISERISDEFPIARIEDARARFYLDNFATIEKWASLRREAATLLVDGLIELAGVFASDAEAADETIGVATNERGTILQLRRPSWIQGVTVGLEWSQSLIGASGQVSLYAGMRQERGLVSEANQRHLLGIGGAACSNLGNVWVCEKVWPVWRWIRPSGERLDDLELYASARRETWRCWDAVAAKIDDLKPSAASASVAVSDATL
jgi:hypothetical protein